ncbi:MAG: heat-shock protein [Gammaproteobacteria bacterium]|nr:heat-shock protein [Gammaproteobacteria bacterium]|tara:strand:- start:767 stop:1225 length:459 start_codon:yes stop_codon:yes gene_type:complete
MTHRNLSIFNKLRPISVGFDDIFNHFESMFDEDYYTLTQNIGSNYPPYNIVRSGENQYDIEIALAGFNKDDINVTVEDRLLTVETKNTDEKTTANQSNEVIHRGISQRYFKKSFTVASDVEVKNAQLKDGLLKISMERVIPEDKKPRTIDIS